MVKIKINEEQFAIVEKKWVSYIIRLILKLKLRNIFKNKKIISMLKIYNIKDM